MKYYNTVRDILYDFAFVFDIPDDPPLGSNIDKDGNHSPWWPTSRRAETSKDFRIVFEREFKKYDGEQNPSQLDLDIFRKRQIEVFQEKRDELKLFENQKSIYYYLKLVEKYIHFLSNELEHEIRSMEPKNNGTLSLAEIALVCIYTNQHVNSTNANEILKKYNPNFVSGRKLVERYNSYYAYPQQRIALSENKKTDNDKLIHFNRVIEYLESNGYNSELAKTERDILKQKIEKYYF